MKLTQNVTIALGAVAVIILVVVGYQHNKSENRNAAAQASSASVASSKADEKKQKKILQAQSSSASKNTGDLSASSSTKKPENAQLNAGKYVVGKNIQEGHYTMSANKGSFKVSLTSKSTSAGSNEMVVQEGSNIDVNLTDDMNVTVTQDSGQKGASYIQLTGK